MKFHCWAGNARYLSWPHFGFPFWCPIGSSVQPGAHPLGWTVSHSAQLRRCGSFPQSLHLRVILFGASVSSAPPKIYDSSAPPTIPMHYLFQYHHFAHCHPLYLIYLIFNFQPNVSEITSLRLLLFTILFHAIHHIHPCHITRDISSRDVKGNGWPADFFEWYNLGVIWSHSLEELWIFSHWGNSHSLPLQTFPHTLAINSLYPIQILHTHYTIPMTSYDYVHLYTWIIINLHVHLYTQLVSRNIPIFHP